MYELTEYIEELTIQQGEGAGEKFKILPWQERFLHNTFNQQGDSALSIARGNGKTTLVAALACAALNGPLAQPHSQVLIVASSHEQGLVCFRHARAFIESQFGIFGDSSEKNWKIRESSNIAEILYKPTGVRCRVLGSNPRHAHGLAPSLTLVDELAQWPETYIDRMLAALQTAKGKVPNSRVIYLGTRAATAEHAFEREIRLAGYSQVHACAKDDAPFELDSWFRANPSLQYMPSLHTAIAEEARRAKLDPARLASFEALRLNKGVPDHVQSVLIGADSWQKAEIDNVEIGEYVLGIDLGSSAAMSAAAAFSWENGHLDAFAVFPIQPDLHKRGYSDGVDDLYINCHQRGEIIQRGQYVSDPVGLLESVQLRWGIPAAIVCDAWREAELRQALDEIDFPGDIPLVVRRMGFQDGGKDVRHFTNAILDGIARPKKQLLLRSAIAGARTISDSAGNQKLAKGGEGRRVRTRDDAVAAAILAVAEGMRHRAQPVDDILGIVI